MTNQSVLAMSRQSLLSLWALAMMCLLAACEAPLKLAGVEQRLHESVHRSDQFQAAGSNKDVIVVVGNQGLVLTSPDNGNTWQRQKLPTWPSLIDVTSCSNGLLAALATEGQVWVSADNGEHWAANTIESEEATQAIQCDPDNRLWVVGSFSSIFHSSDAGKSWEVQALDEDVILTNIQFIDSQTAFISGEFGTMLKSTDSGETWQRLAPLENDFYPQSMYFLDQNNAWIVGLVGEILHTGDAADSWQIQETETIAPLYNLARLGDDMYAVGGEGVLLKQVNNRWQRLQTGESTRMYLRAMLPIGDDRLLVAGQQGALYVLAVNNLQQ